MYWQERMAKSQDKLTRKNIKEIEKQLIKYYGISMQSVIDEFENTYNKLLLTVGDGKEATPADLYKLDKYWQLQGQLRQQLRKLGDKQISALSKAFEIQFFDIYYSINIEGYEAFTTIDDTLAKQIINAIWCADGKSWSERVWKNTDLLQEALNNGLVECVITGKKPTELKKLLQEQFEVSYSRTDAIVRTEMAHIQTQSAQQRYKDYGIQEVEVFVDEDERTCPICAKHEGERYNINAQMPIPFHPRCRCCVVPVVEVD